MVALTCSVGFVRGAVFCCEFKESVGPPFTNFCRNGRVRVEIKYISDCRDPDGQGKYALLNWFSSAPPAERRHAAELVGLQDWSDESVMGGVSASSKLTMGGWAAIRASGTFVPPKNQGAAHQGAANQGN